MDMTKSGLAILLSGLSTFHDANERLEQYPTDSEVGAALLWDAYMHDHIMGKTIADLGAGTGILGIGALVLGAKKVYFVEKDANALPILKKNIKKAIENRISGKHEIINNDISRFSKKTDVVVQNPPFGTREKHNDIFFLQRAFDTAPVVYSLHKTATRRYIEGFAKKSGFASAVIQNFSFPLKKTRDYHKRGIHRIDVSCFRFVKPKPI